MLGVCILIMVLIELALGCGGGGGGGGGYEYETSKERALRVEAMTKIQKEVFGGFDIPPNIANKWVDYWKRYRKDEAADYARNLTDQEKFDDDRTPEKGWPQSWNGLNAGDSGVKNIPPWAWVPINDQSLPTYCFLALDVGTSTGISSSETCNSQSRYAYNPFLKDCLIFQFLGCGGNTNNFVKEEDCRAQCLPHPSQGGCDPDVMQSIFTVSDLDEDWG